jgi:hypothetical protein
MKIKILYNRQYIAFDLYINSIYKIFTSNEFFILNNYDIELINNTSNLLNEDSDFLILFLNDIGLIYNLILNNNTKVIFINPDYILNYSQDDFNMINHYVNHINIQNTFIWEYNYLNIDYYNNNFDNKKYYFIPLLYNNYLEYIYNENKVSISHDKKAIDVLFLGNVDPGSRRKLILDQLSTICNVCIMSGVNNIRHYINTIENSKIVLNIYSKESNMPFDYYRNALLYSNKVFLISEKKRDINLEIQNDLLELNDVLIECNYNDILNTVESYLKKTEYEIESIKQKTYEIFKKNDMDKCVVNFFQQLQL